MIHGTYKTIISNFTKGLREQSTLINESVMKRNYIHKRFQKKGFEPTRIRFVMRNQNQWATFQKHFFDILKLKYNENLFLLNAAMLLQNFLLWLTKCWTKFWDKFGIFCIRRVRYILMCPFASEIQSIAFVWIRIWDPFGKNRKLNNAISAISQNRKLKYSKILEHSKEVRILKRSPYLILSITIFIHCKTLALWRLDNMK